MAERRHLRRAVVAAAFTLLAGSCAGTGELVQNSSTRPVPVPETGLTQTFVARADRLSRVTVTTATYGVDDPNAILHLTIVRDDGETREALLGPEGLDDIAAARFVFPWFEDAAGRRFAATITHRGADPVALYVNHHDPYPEGELSPGSGDLTFELGHAGRLDGALAAAGRVAGDVGGRIGDDPAFAVVWFAALVAAASGLRRRRGDGAG